MKINPLFTPKSFTSYDQCYNPYCRRTGGSAGEVKRLTVDRLNAQETITLKKRLVTELRVVVRAETIQDLSDH